MHSLGVRFCARFSAKPAVQHLFKNQASKPQETQFHKIFDFIGTVPVLRHSCRNVFSMIFALRKEKQQEFTVFVDFLCIVFCI